MKSFPRLIIPPIIWVVELDTEEMMEVIAAQMVQTTDQILLESMDRKENRRKIRAAGRAADR